MSETDTRPAAPANAGDWVELRCGWIIGPLLEDEDGDDFPLVCMSDQGPTWRRDGKYLRGDVTHELDIVAIVQRPDSPPQVAPQQIDPVNHPSHYTSHPSGVECIDITEAFSFNLGNAIKYIWRAGLKSPDAAEDLRKAAWYVNREIKRIEAKQ